MNRTETALAYLGHEADRAVVASIVPRYRLATDVRPGGLGAAIADAPSWTLAPDYLILDTGDVEDPVRAIEQLAVEAPSGDTEVLLIGERNDITLYRDLCQVGVSDYLLRPVNGEELSAMLERVISRRRDNVGVIDPSRLVVVTGTRGGVGASTVAASLAYSMAEQHERRVLLVDLDLNGGTQYLNFNTDPAPGLFEILQSPQRVDALFLERTLVRVAPRLALLSADFMENSIQASEDGLDALLSQVRLGIDNVVIDLPRQSLIGERVMRSAGTIVVVTGLTLPGLRETTRLIDTIERKGSAGNVLIVVNRVGEHRAGVLTAREFAKQIRRDIVPLPFDPRSVTQSLIQAKPLTSFRRPISQALLRLADQLPTAQKRSAGLLDRLLGS